MIWLLLEHIDYENKALVLDGVSYALKDVDFPTINRERPINVQRKRCQRNQVDAVTLLQGVQISVSCRHADHIRNRIFPISLRS